MHCGLSPEMIISTFNLVAHAFDWYDRNWQIIERIITHAKRFRKALRSNINVTDAAIAVSHFDHYYHSLFHMLPSKYLINRQ